MLKSFINDLKILGNCFAFKVGDESADDESATIYPHLLKNVSFFINFIVCQIYLLNADKMTVLPPSLMVLLHLGFGF